MTTTEKNKTALILGGSSGLGLAAAKKLAQEGYDLCIIHRDRKSDLADFEQEMNALRKIGRTVETYNKSALKKETIGEVMSLIEDESIGVFIHSIAKGSLKDMSSGGLNKEDLDITLHAMGTSWWEWIQALIKHNKLASEVRNIAFTSEGNTKVWPGYGAVSAAKATLEALMRQMAVELAPKGVITNCIQAGTTQTTSFSMIPGSDKLAAMATKRNPFNRLTTPEDIANAVYLLCLPEGKWINGTILKVDGGESLR
ncbi:MAG: SDR family oxidoreductase [Flavobacteriaceae bacterium]|nr:SDR family oxidoreductase [Flavobacteriaceae bacterium]